eukprot:m.104935 g.104935  ORF g.104935 m.104935 type:complete len:1233 (+) comp14188_c15_seq1:46-3744(+)
MLRTLKSFLQPSDDFVGTRVTVEGRNVEVKRLIASGGFGMVFLAVDLVTQQQYALKRMIPPDREAARAIAREVATLRAVSSHPNIVSFVGASPRERDEVLILFDFCSDGHLATMVQQRRRPLSHAQVIRLFSQMCAAVQHLHARSPPVIHRDLKLENFLLASNETIKLCDFGSATSTVVDPSTLGFAKLKEAEEEIERNTTPQNRTPEMIDMHAGRPVTEKADIWALGCALFYLCFLAHPFPDAAKLSILSGRIAFPADGFEPFRPIIKQCLEQDPAARPTAADLCARMAELARHTPPDPAAEPLLHSQIGSSLLRSKVENGVNSLLEVTKGKARKIMGLVAKTETRRAGGPAGDLDLTHITPRIIAMASPADGFASISLNGFADLKAYFDRLQKSCLVINCTDKPYDRSRLGCKVEDVPFSERTAPALERLYTLCRTLHDWLLHDRRDIVAVHCQNGLGETGTVIASYLVYARLLPVAKDAIRFFCAKRTLSGSTILTPSQQRYVGYMAELAGGRLPHKGALQMHGLTLAFAPRYSNRINGCRPFVEVYQNGQLVFATNPSNIREADAGAGAVVLSVPVRVRGDIRVIIKHLRQFPTTTMVPMCSFQFYTGYVSGAFILRKEEIDDVLGDSRFEGPFSISVDLRPSDGHAPPVTHEWEQPRHTTDRARETCFWTDDEYAQQLDEFRLLMKKFVDDSPDTHERSDAAGNMGLSSSDDSRPASPFPAAFESQQSSVSTLSNVTDAHLLSLDTPSTAPSSASAFANAPLLAGAAAASSTEKLISFGLDDVVSAPSIRPAPAHTQQQMSSLDLFSDDTFAPRPASTSAAPSLAAAAGAGAGPRRASSSNLMDLSFAPMLPTAAPGLVPTLTPAVAPAAVSPARAPASLTLDDLLSGPPAADPAPFLAPAPAPRPSAVPSSDTFGDLFSSMSAAAGRASVSSNITREPSIDLLGGQPAPAAMAAPLRPAPAASASAPAPAPAPHVAQTASVPGSPLPTHARKESDADAVPRSPSSPQPRVVLGSSPSRGESTPTGRRADSDGSDDDTTHPVPTRQASRVAANSALSSNASASLPTPSVPALTITHAASGAPLAPPHAPDTDGMDDLLSPALTTIVHSGEEGWGSQAEPDLDDVEESAEQDLTASSATAVPLSATTRASQVHARAHARPDTDHDTSGADEFVPEGQAHPLPTAPILSSASVSVKSQSGSETESFDFLDGSKKGGSSDATEDDWGAWE